MAKKIANRFVYKFNTSNILKDTMRGAVLPEMVIGAVFLIIVFFAIVWPQIQEMQKGGDAATIEMAAITTVLSKEENRMIKKQTLAGEVAREALAVQTLLNDVFNQIGVAAKETPQGLMLAAYHKGSQITFVGTAPGDWTPIETAVAAEAASPGASKSHIAAYASKMQEPLVYSGTMNYEPEVGSGPGGACSSNCCMVGAETRCFAGESPCAGAYSPCPNDCCDYIGGSCLTSDLICPGPSGCLAPRDSSMCNNCAEAPPGSGNYICAACMCI